MLKRLMRIALRRGTVGGSRPWLIIGVTAGALRLLGRVVRKEPEVLYRSELEVGQAIVVSLTDTDERPEVRVRPAG